MYVAIGAVAAVGAGYLLWRFALDDKQRSKVKEATKDLVARGRDVAVDGAHKARDLASAGTHKAREAADAVGGRIRHIRD